MTETRRRFDPEFREGAVRIVRETGKPIAQVARELGMNAGSLGNWVAKDKIEVKVEDRDVTIGVEFREEVEANGKALWKERSYGKASRAIRLPEAVDANAALAKHVDGILQLTLPKLAKVNARQITIQ